MNVKKVPDLNLPRPGDADPPPAPKLSDDAYVQWTQYEWQSVVDVRKARDNTRQLRVHHRFEIS